MTVFLAMATRTMEKAIGEQRRCQNRCVDETMATSKPPSLDKDRLNFCLLILLYIIQGFPIGLCIAFPLILQNRKSTYEDQVRKRNYYTLFLINTQIRRIKFVFLRICNESAIVFQIVFLSFNRKKEILFAETPVLYAINL